MTHLLDGAEMARVKAVGRERVSIRHDHVGGIRIRASARRVWSSGSQHFQEPHEASLANCKRKKKGCTRREHLGLRNISKIGQMGSIKELGYRDIRLPRGGLSRAGKRGGRGEE